MHLSLQAHFVVAHLGTGQKESARGAVGNMEGPRNNF